MRIQASAVGDFATVIFSGHEARYSGGAIDNAGMLTVINGTFEANDASFGGAIHNRGNGTARVRGSLFDGNSASRGGAIDQDGGLFEIEATTFSANQAFVGGAIGSKSGDTTVDFSTFRNNTGTLGNTLGMEWGSLDLGRSVLTAPAAQGNLCFGSQYLDTAGGNVLSDGSCIPATAQDDVVGQEIEMSELLNHGGLTRVHVPLCDWGPGGCQSPVFDRGDLLPNCTRTSKDRDQRDQFDRLSLDPSNIFIGGGEYCDVGAYESVCQGSKVDGEQVSIFLHEYQVSDAEPVLLDNGDCFGHPLWTQDSTSGCRLSWFVFGNRFEVDDIVFLDPTCEETCFPDTTLCEQNCTGGGGVTADEFMPTGWTEQDDGSSYSVLVPDCELPELGEGEYLHYLVGLRDETRSALTTGGRAADKSGGSPLGYWDPKTPVQNDGAPDGGGGT